MKSLILRADLLSPDHKVTFKGETSAKTCCGVFMTLIVGSVILATTVFFSVEIFLKEAPIARSISRQSEDSTIMLENYPIMVGFVISGGNFISHRIQDDFIIKARMSSINVYNKIPVESNALKIEPCKEEFFSTSKEIIFSSQSGRNLCINPYEMYDAEGNIIAKKPSISKDFGEHLSKTISIQLIKKPTLSDEQFKEKYGRIDMIVSSAERFVDVEDYEDPIKVRLVTNQIIIDNTIVTSAYVKTSKDSLRTDSGIFFEDYQTKEYNAFKKIDLKYSAKTKNNVLSRIYLNSSSFADIQSREYLKIQTVFAQVGGIAKAITLIGKILVGVLSRYKFYSDNASKAILNSSNQGRIANNSGIALNQTKNSPVQRKEAVTNKSLTLWKFLFWSKQAFNQHFTPKKSLTELFDIERINKILAQRTQPNADERVTRPAVISRFR